MVVEKEPTVGLGCIGMCGIGPPVVTSIYSSRVLVKMGLEILPCTCELQGESRAAPRKS